MRNALAGLVALLFVFAQPAVAAGVNLRWDQCFGDGGPANRAFACNTNSPSHPLVCSFVLPSPVAGVTRASATIRLAAASATLPAWWEVRGTTACRPGAVSALLPIDIFTINCEDWQQANFTGAVGIPAYVIGERGPNTARLEIVSVRTAGAGINLLAGHEYLGGGARFNSVRTVGTPACGGCDIGVCLVLSQIEVASGTTTPTVVLTDPAGAPDANFVTWQGGGGVGVGGAIGCPAATGTRRSAWGAIKSMYR